MATGDLNAPFNKGLTPPPGGRSNGRYTFDSDGNAYIFNSDGTTRQVSSGGGGAGNAAPALSKYPQQSLREGLRVLIEMIPGVTPSGLIHPDGFLLQCPPLEQVEYDYEYTYNDYDTIGGVQFTRSNTNQLAQVTFDTLFVDRANQPWMVVSEADPEYYTHTLKWLCQSGKPFLLTLAHQLPPHGYAEWDLTQIGPEEQMPATLRTLKVTEKAGEGDARYANVTFHEYRDPLVNRWKRGNRSNSGSPKLPTHVTLYHNGTCKDVNGNAIGKPPSIPVTLALLARTFYHDASKWQLIARANKLGSWGAHDQLIDAPKYKHAKQSKIDIPKDPKAKPSKDQRHNVRSTDVAKAYHG